MSRLIFHYCNWGCLLHCCSFKLHCNFKFVMLPFYLPYDTVFRPQQLSQFTHKNYLSHIFCYQSSFIHCTCTLYLSLKFLFWIIDVPTIDFKSLFVSVSKERLENTIENTHCHVVSTLVTSLYTTPVQSYLFKVKIGQAYSLRFL